MPCLAHAYSAVSRVRTNTQTGVCKASASIIKTTHRLGRKTRQHKLPKLILLRIIRGVCGVFIRQDFLQEQFRFRKDTLHVCQHGERIALNCETAGGRTINHLRASLRPLQKQHNNNLTRGVRVNYTQTNHRPGFALPFQSVFSATLKENVSLL